MAEPAAELTPRGWRARARQLKREARALSLMARDPRTLWHARLVAGIVVAYAFSPIDLIPDMIPVLGLFDDLILIPLGVWLAVRLVPDAVVRDARAAAAAMDGKPISRIGALVIVVIWIVAVLLAWFAVEQAI